MNSLFDALEETVPSDDWQEVLQDRFLSWSDKMQWAYCARRDENSALYAVTDEETLWFAARAEMYKEMIRETSN